MNRQEVAEADGGPLAVIAAAANVHDTKLFAATAGAAVRPPRPCAT
jgi:hypothetical protein